MEITILDSQLFSRTDRLIMTAFIKLLEKHPISKISVTDICEEAVIRRATFYNHFESKEQLLIILMDSLKEQLFQSIIDNSDKYSINDLFYKIAEKTINFVAENKEKIAQTIKNINLDSYNTLLLESINQSFKYIIGHSKNKIKLDIPIELITRFYSGGCANLTMWWLTTENNYTKEDLIKEVEMFIIKPFTNQFANNFIPD